MTQIFVPQQYSPYSQTSGTGINYQNGQPQTQQQGSTPGMGLNNFGSVFNNGNNSIFGNTFGDISSTITQGINRAGAGLGIGTSYTAPIGPSLTGAPMASAYSPGIFSGTTASGLLSGAGVGSLVGGLVGGGGMGSNIGGGIGGAIGSVIAPGIGSVIGGALGGIAGGLFGGKKKARVSLFSNVSDATGSLGKAPTIGKKTLDDKVGDTTFKSVQPYIQGLAGILGPLKPMQVVGGTHSKWGGNFLAAVPQEKMIQNNDILGNVPREYIKNFKDDSTFGTAVNDMLYDMAKYSGYSDEQITSAIKTMQQNTAGGRAAGVSLGISPQKEGNFKQFVTDYKARTNAPATVTNK